MSNPYLTSDEIRDTFLRTIAVHLEENHNFTEEDLDKIASGFIMAASNKIAKVERDMCVKFVKSLNRYVGEALEEKRGNL